MKLKSANVDLLMVAVIFAAVMFLYMGTELFKSGRHGSRNQAQDEPYGPNNSYQRSYQRDSRPKGSVKGVQHRNKLGMTTWRMRVFSGRPNRLRLR